MDEIMTDMEAYRIATRVYASLHSTERDALDQSASYNAVLNAVMAEDIETALSLLQTLRTDAGDKWRVKYGFNFAGNDFDKFTRPAPFGRIA